MSCSRCGPSQYSIEHTRRYKPENNNGCGCSNRQNNCNSESLAKEGSPLWNWEKEYGRLVTVFKEEIVNGKTITVYEKIPCGQTSSDKSSSCCSFKYKLVR